MVLYFITGNKNKFEEAKEILGNVEQLDIELNEIQELDSRKIIEEKLKEACKVRKGEFFCEDTSLCIDCLGGLPGPLIRWFLKTIKVDGIWGIVKNFKDHKALARTIVGYTDGSEMKFFTGEIEGEIVPPSGETTFGWDPIFLPKGYKKTFQEMSRSEKNKISMRRIAMEKLAGHLNKYNRR